MGWLYFDCALNGFLNRRNDFVVGLGGNHGIEAELADGQEESFDMAVGQSFLGSEQILGRDEGFVAQQAAEGLDFFLGPIGEVGQGALAGFVAFAPALAEEDGGRGVAVGDGFDVHGSYYAHLLIIVKHYMLFTWEHFHRVKLGLRSNKSETYRRIWPDFFWNFGLTPP